MSRPYDAEPKDFLAVKGPFGLHISPQTARGRRAAFLWVLAILAPDIPFLLWSLSVAGTPQEKWILVGLMPVLVATGLIVWAMIRWMLKRADIVSPEDIRNAARKSHRGRR